MTRDKRNDHVNEGGKNQKNNAGWKGKGVRNPQGKGEMVSE